jgi:tetratricopeptide (TPR) repeat protein
MHSLQRFERVEVPPEAIERITALYERGLYVQAYAEAKRFGELRGWSGAAACVIGGRLAGNVGSLEIATWLRFRARREDRANTEAAYFYGISILERRGPLAALKFLERLPACAPDDPFRGDLLGFRSQVLATFRDFEQAERTLAEAESLGHNVAWLWCERSSLYEMQDRYPEALEAAQRALSERPWFRPAVQRAAHLMQLLGRDECAASLLEEALGHIESGACAGQLSAILEELGDYSGAVAAWKQMRDLNPLLSEKGIEGWHARMADLLYLSNAPLEAAEHARLSKDEGFYSKFAERLKAPDRAGKRRVHLPVGFVRQHHVTCVPATLSAISGYLGQPIDHAAIAKEITYDGTPDHMERAWLERNGFCAREFRVTWEAATALIDRGIPFTLTTTDITSGHLQAVIGYDALRETLIIRDPYQRHHSEFNVEPLLKRYAAFGPRGMVLLPENEAHRLDGLEFPDSAFFDAYYQLRRATYLHNRAAADAALKALEELDPNHRLTHFARRELAYYDGNVVRQLSSTEALLELYPDQGNFLLGKSRALSELAKREEHESFLRELSGKDVDPLFWREWAAFLSSDARRRGEAHRLILRALHYRPIDSDNLVARANLLWDDREFSTATKLYRLGACLRDTIDSYSRSYFLASRHLRETETALSWLRLRYERFGLQSSQPARILFWALQTLDRSQEGFAVLEQAIARRPADGDLLLHASDAFARQGQFERAESLLTTAKSCSGHAAWLRTAAAIADYRCDLTSSLALWRELFEAEPLALDAQRSTIRLIAEVEGRPAAFRQIEQLAERFPHNVPLHRLWVEWARFEGASEWERITRRSLALDPGDAWLRRELALALAEKREFDNAITEARSALAIEPQIATSHSILGSILLRAQRQADAREALKSALRLSVDTSSAFHDLIAASPTLEEKRAAAEFIRSELVRQVVFGDGVLTFREAFYTILDHEEMLAAMREAHTARPDLWHAWAALIRQLVDMGRLDEALTKANECAERFPLVPAAWSDLALVHRLQGNRESEIRALRRALIISPGWTVPARELSSAHEARAEFDDARRVLESAIAASPLEAPNFGMLADLLWRRGERELAIERVVTAVQRDPGYSWGWDALRAWTAEIGTPERALDVARSLNGSRPGEARSWFFLAQILPEGQVEEALAALDRALELSPRFIDAHDFRAFLLSREGRFDEAVAACRPPAFEGEVPAALLGRAAWLEAARGHVPLAIEMTRDILKAHPDYYWGWSQIASWSFQIGRHQDSLDAAKMLVRLAPRASAPLAILARAQHALGRGADALGSLGRAFDLDPTYEFAGYTLFDHHLEARNLQKAEEILKRLTIHLPGPRTDSAQIRLAAMRGDRDAAMNGLRTLLFRAGELGVPLHEAVTACLRPGWESLVERLLAEVLDQSGVNPEAGALWVNRFTSVGKWGNRRRLYKLDPRSDLGRRARYAYVGALGERRKLAYLKKLINRERNTLHENTPIWGQIGYAFAANERWSDAIFWLSDWRERRGLEPWMLSNLALALRHEARDVDARMVNEHALTLHGDHTTSEHHTWMALATAMDGKMDEARVHLDRSQKPNDSKISSATHALANALITVSTANPDMRKAVFEQQKNILCDPKFRASFRSPMLKGIGQQAVQQLAAAGGAKPFKLVRFRDRYGSSEFKGSNFQYGWAVVLICIVLANIARLASPSSSPYDSRSIERSGWPITPRPRIPAEKIINAEESLKARPIPPQTEERKPVITLQPPPQYHLPPIRLEPIPTPKPTPKPGRE